jgi:hypothetical protein
MALALLSGSTNIGEDERPVICVSLLVSGVTSIGSIRFSINVSLIEEVWKERLVVLLIIGMDGVG